MNRYDQVLSNGKESMDFLLMKIKLNPYGKITLNRELCIGCGMCIEVCPRNLYEMNEGDKKVDLHTPEDCINCNACVRRCPQKCLEIVPN